jgi:glycerol-3-phosphate dehydrogenase
VYRQTRRRPWKIALGLGIYSLFSRKRFHRIPQRQWSRLDGLRTDDLDAVFSYYDAQTDDARLTRAVLESARNFGADVITRARFTHATVYPDDVSVTYVANGESNNITARVLVNAAGPWVNHVLASVNKHSGGGVQTHPIELVQGSHVVVAGEISHPYYLEAPQDGRAVFVVPWKNKIMIGTTESRYQGEPEDVAPQAAEIDYLLDIYNHYFNARLGTEDVVEAFAGLRVLPAGAGAAFSKSRDTFLYQENADRPRVVSIYGGKLTSYRASAEKLMTMIARSLPAATPLADTRTLELPLID